MAAGDESKIANRPLGCRKLPRDLKKQIIVSVCMYVSIKKMIRSFQDNFYLFKIKYVPEFVWFSAITTLDMVKNVIKVKIR